MNNTITAIHGIKVGHAADPKSITGCTVLLFKNPVVTSVEARGGWPGTFDTDSVASGKTFYRKHAIFLTGGDVFGLACAKGIQRYLIERGIASKDKPGQLPAVVGANIYDVDFGHNVADTDYSKLGYEACHNASRRPVNQGNHGAGIGATVGKLKGIKYATKGGVGSSVTRILFGVQVGALVVTNSLGNVFDESGRTIAGTRKDVDSRVYVEIEDLMEEYVKTMSTYSKAKATTIGVVATNLQLSHEHLLKVTEMAHDGFPRCIRPAHATIDGDTLFSVSTAYRRTDNISHALIDLVGHVAAMQVTKAILNAVRNATALNGIPSIG
jgi:L-aminopeptidase/D-esterase-like protein